MGPVSKNRKTTENFGHGLQHTLWQDFRRAPLFAWRINFLPYQAINSTVWSELPATQKKESSVQSHLCGSRWSFPENKMCCGYCRNCGVCCKAKSPSSTTLGPEITWTGICIASYTKIKLPLGYLTLCIKDAFPESGEITLLAYVTRHCKHCRKY